MWLNCLEALFWNVRRVTRVAFSLRRPTSDWRSSAPRRHKREVNWERAWRGDVTGLLLLTSWETLRRSLEKGFYIFAMNLLHPVHITLCQSNKLLQSEAEIDYHKCECAQLYMYRYLQWKFLIDSSRHKAVQLYGADITVVYRNSH